MLHTLASAKHPVTKQLRCYRKIKGRYCFHKIHSRFQCKLRAVVVHKQPQQLSAENKNMEIMVDYEKRETITLEKLIPFWWGTEWYEQE